MDLTNKNTISSLLKKHNVWAKKSLGQNFLIDKQALEDIVRTTNLSKEDLVLEVGPGVGVLTQELCKEAGYVISIELDKRFIQILKETCGEFGNLEIINEDILKWNINELRAKSLELRAQGPKFKVSNYKVVSNLPYNITSAVIRKFLETEKKPIEMVLMVQKEVAKRICAKPPNMNLLAVSVQFYAKPKIIRFVKNTSFWPKPEVNSAILKVAEVTKVAKAAEVRDEKLFFRIVKAGFGEKRKQLINSLSGGLRMSKEEIAKLLKKSNIKLTQRAEELSLEDWIKIYNNYMVIL